MLPDGGPRPTSVPEPGTAARGAPVAARRSVPAKRLPRLGFLKGAALGVVVVLPTVAAGVWVLSRAGIGHPGITMVEALRMATLFAGVAAVLTAGGIGRLAAHASTTAGGLRTAIVRSMRAQAVAGAGLVFIAAIPHGDLPAEPWVWMWFGIAGLIGGALCGLIIGLVCGAPVVDRLPTVPELARLIPRLLPVSGSVEARPAATTTTTTSTSTTTTTATTATTATVAATAAAPTVAAAPTANPAAAPAVTAAPAAPVAPAAPELPASDELAPHDTPAPRTPEAGSPTRGGEPARGEPFALPLSGHEAEPEREPERELTPPPEPASAAPTDKDHARRQRKAGRKALMVESARQEHSTPRPKLVKPARHSAERSGERSAERGAVTSSPTTPIATPTPSLTTGAGGTPLPMPVPLGESVPVRLDILDPDAIEETSIEGRIGDTVDVGRTDPGVERTATGVTDPEVTRPRGERAGAGAAAQDSQPDGVAETAVKDPA